MTENNIPKHIAIIMDGNGRWAKERDLKRTVGHEEGAKRVRDITTHCSNIGVKYLTLYAFFNRKLDKTKIRGRVYNEAYRKLVKKELPVYLENQTRLKAIGDISKFSKSLQKTIKETEERTSHGTKLTQVLALNYGSQDEMLRAMKKMQEKDLEITKENFESCLDTAGMPPVDMLIRTSGEVRLSNYLLWQNAYAEMFFTQTYWPEFYPRDLDDLISDFTNRERRFGGI